MLGRDRRARVVSPLFERVPRRSVAVGHRLKTIKESAVGRRLACAVLNGAVTYYVYDGAHPIMEYEATHGTEVGNWVYGRGIDEVLARSNNGQGQYFLQDRLGNTSAIIGGAEGGPGFTGKVLEFYRYDAFGVARFFHFDENNVAMETQKTVINNRFLFTGREWQEKFGFYEFRARAYNPTIGRFMSEDPKGYDAGDYNLYRYCENDPWDKTDPMGLFGRPFGEWRDDEWKTYYKTQQSAIAIDTAAKHAIDHALKDGKDKASQSTVKAMKQVFGVADRQTMQKVSNALASRLSALRDDGNHGYWAHPTTDKKLTALGFNPSKTVAYNVPRNQNIYVNVGHPWSDKTLTWAIDHESGHSACGFADFAYMHQIHDWNYNAMSTDQRLINADSNTAVAHLLGEP